jgi:hypothetical protein
MTEKEAVNKFPGAFSNKDGKIPLYPGPSGDHLMALHPTSFIIKDNKEHTFTITDSGEREQFAGGMQRDTTAGKSRPDLVRDGPMLLRWVAHLTKGAVKYIARNWMRATGEEEYNRFLESADRHYTIWYTWRKYAVNIEDANNPTSLPLTEDHAAALFFNVNGVEYLQEHPLSVHTTIDEEVS